MTGHINRHGWIVLSSVESEDRLFCVDFFQDPRGGFGFELFRSDPEDGGIWTRTSRFGGVRYDTLQDAVDSAHSSIPWLREG